LHRKGAPRRRPPTGRRSINRLGLRSCRGREPGRYRFSPPTGQSRAARGRHTTSRRRCERTQRTPRGELAAWIFRIGTTPKILRRDWIQDRIPPSINRPCCLNCRGTQTFSIILSSRSSVIPTGADHGQSGDPWTGGTCCSEVMRRSATDWSKYPNT